MGIASYSHLTVATISAYKLAAYVKLHIASYMGNFT